MLVGGGPLKYLRLTGKKFLRLHIYLLTADLSLILLIRIVKCEGLGRACLGMYELELAYMVLAHSQRDPGEYLLELQQLASHPVGPLRHFAINMHLQRTSAALANLLAAGDEHFQRALTLAREEVIPLFFPFDGQILVSKPP